MRSLRDVLIKGREAKGLTVNQVAYETNISKKYIEALEDEDFDVFPAEAYLLGFLRNYAEFLDIEYETILAEYKNCLLREEPTPLSELMGVKKRIELKPWMIITPIIILILALTVPPLVERVGEYIEKRKEALRLRDENQVKTYDISEDFLDNKVKVGDSFVKDIGEDRLLYIIQEVKSDLILTEIFKGQESVITLKLGSEVSREFMFDGKKHIITLYLKDIGGFSDESAIMKIKSEVKELAISNREIAEKRVENSTGKESRVIMVKQRSPDPYSISIKFEGDILFRYQQKDEALYEDIYQKDSVLTLDVTRSIKIWTSNAGLTKFKLNGETIVLGKTGEVHVFTLRWIYIKEKDEYRLEYATAY